MLVKARQRAALRELGHCVQMVEGVWTPFASEVGSLYLERMNRPLAPEEIRRYLYDGDYDEDKRPLGIYESARVELLNSLEDRGCGDAARIFRELEGVPEAGETDLRAAVVEAAWLKSQQNGS